MIFTKFRGRDVDAPMAAFENQFGSTTETRRHGDHTKRRPKFNGSAYLTQRRWMAGNAGSEVLRRATIYLMYSPWPVAVACVFAARGGGRDPPRAAAIVLESTGGLERPLLDALLDPGKVRHFAKGLGILAKTDAADAAVLARFALLASHRPAEQRTANQPELDALVTCRRQRVATRTAQRNRRGATASRRRPAAPGPGRPCPSRCSPGVPSCRLWRRCGTPCPERGRWGPARTAPGGPPCPSP